MKVRIVQRPTGSINGQPWPEVGETIELAEVSAISMLNAGQVEAIKESATDKVETRPAATSTETRKPRTRRRKG